MHPRPGGDDSKVSIKIMKIFFLDPPDQFKQILNQIIFVFRGFTNVTQNSHFKKSSPKILDQFQLNLTQANLGNSSLFKRSAKAFLQRNKCEIFFFFSFLRNIPVYVWIVFMLK